MLAHGLSLKLTVWLATLDKKIGAVTRKAIRSFIRAALEEAENFRNVPVTREVLDLYEASLMARARDALAEEIVEELTPLLDKPLRLVSGVFDQALSRGGAARLIREAIERGARMDLGNVAIRGVTFLEALEHWAEDAAGRVGGLLRERWAEEFNRAMFEGLSGAEAVARAATATGLELSPGDVRRALGVKELDRLSRLCSDYLAAAADQYQVQMAAQHKALVAGFQWVATLDRKTCPACAALDGRRWYFESPDEDKRVENMPPVPLHPNCRCTRVAVFYPDIDPTPPKTMTYQEWFESLTEEDKVEVLGRKRYELYRQGIPLSELVDDRGKLVPLEVLEERLQKYRAVELRDTPVAFAPWDRLDVGRSAEVLTQFLNEALPVYPKSGNIKPETYRAIRMYQGEQYANMNLVAAGVPLSPRADPPVSVLAENVAAMRRFYEMPGVQLRRPIVVYRGAALEDIEAILREGAYIRSNRFLSASLNANVAEHFAVMQSTAKTPVLVEMRVPRGTPVLVPAPFTDSLFEEAEVILPARCVFRVDKVERRGGVARVVLTLVEARP